MITGIKISSPCTISLNALHKLLFFAVNHPRVEIVLKPAQENKTSFSLYGIKDYEEDFIYGILDYLYSLEIFKDASKIHADITNKIPLHSGLGGHMALFCCFLKGLCAVNKLSYTNRELYNIMVDSGNNFIKDEAFGRILACLEGGAMFTDKKEPSLFHRIYMPSGVSWILYRAGDVLPEVSTRLADTELAKSVELLLGLHTGNWDFIRQGFEDIKDGFSIPGLNQEQMFLLKENSVGIDYHKNTGMYTLLCNSTLKAGICHEVLLSLSLKKKPAGQFLYNSLPDMVGCIKM